MHESASLRAVTGPLLRPGGFPLTERGLSLCGFTPGARIADVGCGTGASVAYLRESHRLKALGFDLSGKLIRNAGCAKKIPFAQARAEALPLADGCCDGVLCECVLSIVPEPERAIGEFYRILQNDGFLILSDIYSRSSIEGCCGIPAGAGGCASILRTRVFIEELLENPGFRIIAWEDHTRHLRELAGQLILNGGSLAEIHELCNIFDSVCSGTSGPAVSRPGYYLLVAKKIAKGGTFHG